MQLLLIFTFFLTTCFSYGAEHTSESTDSTSGLNSPSLFKDEEDAKGKELEDESKINIENEHPSFFYLGEATFSPNKKLLNESDTSSTNDLSNLSQLEKILNSAIASKKYRLYFSSYDDENDRDIVIDLETGLIDDTPSPYNPSPNNPLKKHPKLHRCFDWLLNSVTDLFKFGSVAAVATVNLIPLLTHDTSYAPWVQGASIILSATAGTLVIIKNFHDTRFHSNFYAAQKKITIPKGDLLKYIYSKSSSSQAKE